MNMHRITSVSARRIERTSYLLVSLERRILCLGRVRGTAWHLWIDGHYHIRKVVCYIWIEPAEFVVLPGTCSMGGCMGPPHMHVLALVWELLHGKATCYIRGGNKWALLCTPLCLQAACVYITQQREQCRQRSLVHLFRGGTPLGARCHAVERTSPRPLGCPRQLE